MATEIPLCPVFGQCGGCQHQDIPYDEELSLKATSLRDTLLLSLGKLSFDLKPIVPSPNIYHYRNRLDLKLKKTRDGLVHIGFSAVGQAVILEIENCPIAMDLISRFIPQLRKDAGTLLPPGYRMANLTVRCGDGEAVRWGGIGHGSTRLAGEEYFFTDLNGLRIHYSLDSFFQANLSILPKLFDVLRSFPIWSKEAIFFDLYGGVGLFGLGVHDLVKRSVNIEENAHAVEVARHNIQFNKLANVLAFAGRVEDLLPQILAQVPSGEHIVMVDPPRAGLSKATIELLNGLRHVQYLVYLSCDPESLAENLLTLSKGPWQIMSAQPFDFFPRTRHLETLVLLKRNNGRP